MYYENPMLPSLTAVTEPTLFEQFLYVGHPFLCAEIQRLGWSGRIDPIKLTRCHPVSQSFHQWNIATLRSGSVWSTRLPGNAGSQPDSNKSPLIIISCSFFSLSAYFCFFSLSVGWFLFRRFFLGFLLIADAKEKGKHQNHHCYPWEFSTFEGPMLCDCSRFWILINSCDFRLIISDIFS